MTCYEAWADRKVFNVHNCKLKRKDEGERNKTFMFIISPGLVNRYYRTENAS